jgi:endonuclease YncB( thermonuclease family)
VVVRLDQIDAPKKAQPFGQRAGQSLADLAFQETARVAGGIRPVGTATAASSGRLHVGGRDV